jgi:hypothetical protein
VETNEKVHGESRPEEIGDQDSQVSAKDRDFLLWAVFLFLTRESGRSACGRCDRLIFGNKVFITERVMVTQG